MPVSISLEFGDFEKVERNDRTRISLAFARFCWEATGPSSWRYPAASPHPPVSEDWFNHVIPALMYLRSIVLAKGIVVRKFTLDAHSQSLFRARPNGNVGVPILPACEIHLSPADEYSSSKQLSEQRLAAFLDGCTECAVSRKPPETDNMENARGGGGGVWREGRDAEWLAGSPGFE